MEESNTSKDCLASASVVTQSDGETRIPDKESDQNNTDSVSESTQESSGNLTGTVHTQEVSKDVGVLLESVKETDIETVKEADIETVKETAQQVESSADNSRHTESDVDKCNKTSTKIESGEKTTTVISSCSLTDEQDDTSNVKEKEMLSEDVDKKLTEKAIPSSTSDSKVESKNMIEQAETSNVEPAKTNTIDSAKMNTIEQAKTDTIEQAKTDTIEQAKTDTIEQAKTDTIEQAKTDTIEQAKTDTIEQAKTDTIEQAKTDTIEQAKTDTIEQAKTDTIEQAKTDTIEQAKTDTIEQAKTDTIEQAKTDTIEQAKTDTIEQAKTDTLEQAKTDTLVQAKTKEQAETNKIDPLKTNIVEPAKTNTTKQAKTTTDPAKTIEQTIKTNTIEQVNTNTNNTSGASPTVNQPESPEQVAIPVKPKTTSDVVTPSCTNSTDIESKAQKEELPKSSDTDNSSSKTHEDQASLNSENKEGKVDNSIKETSDMKPADNMAQADDLRKSYTHQKTNEVSLLKSEGNCKGAVKEEISDKPDIPDNIKTEDTNISSEKTITEPSNTPKSKVPESKTPEPTALESATEPKLTEPSKEVIENSGAIKMDSDVGLDVDKESVSDIDAAKEKEPHTVFTVVEQIDETSPADIKTVEPKTDAIATPAVVESASSKPSNVNVNNNAKGAAEKDKGCVAGDGKQSSDPARSKEDSGKLNNSKSKDAAVKTDHKPIIVVGNKADELKAPVKTGTGAKKDGTVVEKEVKDDAKPDLKDARDVRPSKSYSAQRTANRTNRKVAGAASTTSDRKDKKDDVKAVSETKKRDENRQQEEDSDRDAKRKDQQRDRGKLKEAERIGDKSKSRDDKRDKRSSPSTHETRREREDAERKRRDEERRKRDEERRRKDEDRKKREEERKKKDEERKKQVEEERKRAAERKIEEEKRRQEEEKKRQEDEQKRLEEEAVRLKEEEERHAKEISVESVERIANKMETRATNLAASENHPDESFFTRLDSSLKKNTAFVKKLRVMTEANRLALKKEFNTLNLTKYVGEVATSIAEAKLKMSDVSCAIHICSLVHQRYADFSKHMLQAIQKVLPAVPSKKDKEKDEQKLIVFDSKIRVELRFLAELIVAGIFTEKEGFPLLNGVLSTILHSDKEKHSNLPIITSFTKHCGEDFAGFVPRKNRLIAEKFNVTVPASEVFSAQVKNAYRNLLRDHYTSVTKYLLRKHNDLQNFERQNMRMLQTKGELSDERQKNFEETQASYQKLLMNTSTFSDLIDEDMPNLPIDEKLKEENELMSMDFYRADGSTIEFDFETSLWEDEDTRTFHENLIDLRTMVPAILFKDSEKRAAPGDKCEDDLDKFDEDIEAMEVSETAQEAEMTEEDEDDESKAPGEQAESKEEATVDDMESGEPETEDPDDDEDEEEEEVASHNVSMKVMLDAYLQKLPQCVNRDFIDREAVEFCMNLNTKSNRKKLVKALFNVPRTRLDLLAFYSRLVATLYPCMPDIATDLVEKLKQDFRWHMRKKDQMKIESKVKIVRFLGELTKFKMCPKADTLQCLKQLLLVFQHHNIEMACNLLDVCGRYLYRSKDSHLRTKALLDLMMRKRNKMHLNERHSTMVENAFFYCNPPESKKMEQKVRPPLHEYIRKLLFKDLTKVTVEKVLKQMRKLPWNDIEIQRYAVKCLSSVWNVKYNNVHCMANLLAGLVLYHDYVGIQVVDTVLEDIRMGMEINFPKFNQRRVSVAKYLGELYNYRMLESSVIFKTLYSFIRFGVSLNPETPSILDPPEHLFRIRLCCTLLDTCGQFFDRGTSKKKLDCFLVYFQQYILHKRIMDIWNQETRPFPLDVDNAIADTFDCVRPKLNLFTTLEEANAAVEELEKEFVQKLGDVINLARQTEAGGSLSTITEVSDEAVSSESPAGGRRLSFVTAGTEDEYDSDSDSEDVRRPKRDNNSNPNSQSQGLSQNTEEGRYDTDENLLLESAGENEDDDRVTVLTGGPKLVECEEDEDFTSAFDKMMSENLQQRTVEAAKVPQLDIGIPVQATKVSKPKKTFDIFNPMTEVEERPVTSTMNFTLMTRSGKKQQYHEFEVPIVSELAANLRNREMAELAEKQRMKELTLHINERQEEEDYQEMIASLQKPAIVAPPGAVTVHPVRPVSTGQPRERKSRFHHPKGAPDADQIFHQTGNRKW